MGFEASCEQHEWCRHSAAQPSTPGCLSSKCSWWAYSDGFWLICANARLKLWYLLVLQFLYGMLITPLNWKCLSSTVEEKWELALWCWVANSVEPFPVYVEMLFWFAQARLGITAFLFSSQYVCLCTHAYAYSYTVVIFYCCTSSDIVPKNLFS